MGLFQYREQHDRRDQCEKGDQGVQLRPPNGARKGLLGLRTLRGGTPAFSWPFRGFRVKDPAVELLRIIAYNVYYVKLWYRLATVPSAPRLRIVPAQRRYDQHGARVIAGRCTSNGEKMPPEKSRTAAVAPEKSPPAAFLGSRSALRRCAINAACRPDQRRADGVATRILVAPARGR